MAIRADPRRSKPAELPVHVPKRAAQPFVGPRCRQRGPGPLSVPAQLTWRTATPPPPALEGQLPVAIGAKPHEAKPTELHVATPKPGALVSAVLKGRQRVPSPLPVPGSGTSHAYRARASRTGRAAAHCHRGPASSATHRRAARCSAKAVRLLMAMTESRQREPGPLSVGRSGAERM